MPDAHYTDPRLARVYDVLNPPGADTAFHAALIGPTPRRVLDLGCGTGSFAVELARQRHRVTGVDPAAAMLAVARARPGGERVRWIESDAAGLALPERFDHAVMTGHVFQVFLDDEEALAALQALRRHLAPGGRLSFETRNPAARAWECWTPEETRASVEVPGLGSVTVWHALQAVEGEFVSFASHFDFGGDDRVATHSRLRFVTQAMLARLLAEAGFDAVEWCGDWDGSPVMERSPELIVVAG